MNKINNKNCYQFIYYRHSYLNIYNWNTQYQLYNREFNNNYTS